MDSNNESYVDRITKQLQKNVRDKLQFDESTAPGATPLPKREYIEDREAQLSNAVELYTDPEGVLRQISPGITPEQPPAEPNPNLTFSQPDDGIPEEGLLRKLFNYGKDVISANVGYVQALLPRAIQAVGAVGQPDGTSWLKEWGEGFEDWLLNDEGQREAMAKHPILGNVGQIIVPLGTVALAAGLWRGGLIGAKTFNQAQLGVGIGTAGIFAGVGVDEVQDELDDYEERTGQNIGMIKQTAVQTLGLLGGILEAAIPLHIAKAPGTGTHGFLKHLVSKDTLVTAGAEGVQEGLTETIYNTAQKVYDDEAKWLEGTLESTLYGAGTALAASPIISGLLVSMRRNADVAYKNDSEEKFAEWERGIDKLVASEQLGKPAAEKLVEKGRKNMDVMGEMVDRVGAMEISRMESDGKLKLYSWNSEAAKDKGLTRKTLAQRPKGVYQTKSNRVVMILENIKKGEGFNVLLHELGVHYGLRNVIGKRVIRQMLRSADNEQTAIWKAARARAEKGTAKTLSNRDRYVREETLAYFIEHNSDQTLMQQVRGNVSSFLKNSVGFNDAISGRLTDNEIKSVIKGAVHSISNTEQKRGQMDDEERELLSRDDLVKFYTPDDFKEGVHPWSSIQVPVIGRTRGMKALDKLGDNSLSRKEVVKILKNAGDNKQTLDLVLNETFVNAKNDKKKASEWLRLVKNTIHTDKSRINVPKNKIRMRVGLDNYMDHMKLEGYSLGDAMEIIVPHQGGSHGGLFTPNTAAWVRFGVNDDKKEIAIFEIQADIWRDWINATKKVGISRVFSDTGKSVTEVVDGKEVSDIKRDKSNQWMSFVFRNFLKNIVDKTGYTNILFPLPATASAVQNHLKVGMNEELMEEQVLDEIRQYGWDRHPVEIVKDMHEIIKTPDDFEELHYIDDEMIQFTNIAREIYHIDEEGFGERTDYVLDRRYDKLLKISHENMDYWHMNDYDDGKDGGDGDSWLKDMYSQHLSHVVQVLTKQIELAKKYNKDSKHSQDVLAKYKEVWAKFDKLTEERVDGNFVNTYADVMRKIHKSKSMEGIEKLIDESINSSDHRYYSTFSDGDYFMGLGGGEYLVKHEPEENGEVEYSQVYINVEIERDDIVDEAVRNQQDYYEYEASPEEKNIDMTEYHVSEEEFQKLDFKSPHMTKLAENVSEDGIPPLYLTTGKKFGKFIGKKPELVTREDDNNNEFQFAKYDVKDKIKEVKDQNKGENIDLLSKDDDVRVEFHSMSQETRATTKAIEFLAKNPNQKMNTDQVMKVFEKQGVKGSLRYMRDLITKAGMGKGVLKAGTWASMLKSRMNVERTPSGWERTPKGQFVKTGGEGRQAGYVEIKDLKGAFLSGMKLAGYSESDAMQFITDEVQTGHTSILEEGTSFWIRFAVNQNDKEAVIYEMQSDLFRSGRDLDGVNTLLQDDEKKSGHKRKWINFGIRLFLKNVMLKAGYTKLLFPTPATESFIQGHLVYDEHGGEDQLREQAIDQLPNGDLTFRREGQAHHEGEDFQDFKLYIRDSSLTDFNHNLKTETILSLYDPRHNFRLEFLKQLLPEDGFYLDIERDSVIKIKSTFDSVNAKGYSEPLLKEYYVKHLEDVLKYFKGWDGNVLKDTINRVQQTLDTFKASVAKGHSYQTSLQKTADFLLEKGFLEPSAFSGDHVETYLEVPISAGTGASRHYLDTISYGREGEHVYVYTMFFPGENGNVNMLIKTYTRNNSELSQYFLAEVSIEEGSKGIIQSEMDAILEHQGIDMDDYKHNKHLQLDQEGLRKIRDKDSRYMETLAKTSNKPGIGVQYAELYKRLGKFFAQEGELVIRHDEGNDVDHQFIMFDTEEQAKLLDNDGDIELFSKSDDPVRKLLDENIDVWATTKGLSELKALGEQKLTIKQAESFLQKKGANAYVLGLVRNLDDPDEAHSASQFYSVLLNKLFQLPAQGTIFSEYGEHVGNLVFGKLWGYTDHMRNPDYDMDMVMQFIVPGEEGGEHSGILEEGTSFWIRFAMPKKPDKDKPVLLFEIQSDLYRGGNKDYRVGINQHLMDEEGSGGKKRRWINFAMRLFMRHVVEATGFTKIGFPSPATEGFIQTHVGDVGNETMLREQALDRIREKYNNIGVIDLSTENDRTRTAQLLHYMRDYNSDSHQPPNANVLGFGSESLYQLSSKRKLLNLELPDHDALIKKYYLNYLDIEIQQHEKILEIKRSTGIPEDVKKQKLVFERYKQAFKEAISENLSYIDAHQKVLKSMVSDASGIPAYTKDFPESWTWYKVPDTTAPGVLLGISKSSTTIDLMKIPAGSTKNTERFIFVWKASGSGIFAKHALVDVSIKEHPDSVGVNFVETVMEEIEEENAGKVGGYDGLRLKQEDLKQLTNPNSDYMQNALHLAKSDEGQGIMKQYAEINSRVKKLTGQEGEVVQMETADFSLKNENNKKSKHDFIVRDITTDKVQDQIKTPTELFSKQDTKPTQEETDTLNAGKKAFANAAKLMEKVPSKVPSWMREFLLGFYPNIELANKGKGLFRSPLITRLTTLEDQKDAYRQAGYDMLSRWAKRFLKLSETEREQLADVAQETTLRKFNPTDYDKSKKLSKIKKSLLDAYGALNEEQQALYKDIQKTFQRARDKLGDTILKRMEDYGYDGEILDKIREQLQAINPYFPLSRFGDYFIQYVNGKRKEFSMFDTEAQWRDAKADLDAKGLKILKAGKNPSKNFNHKDGSVYEQLLKTLEELEMEDESKQTVIDMIKRQQIYNSSATSLMHRTIHRRGVRGFSREFFRSVEAGLNSNMESILSLTHSEQQSKIMARLKKELENKAKTSDENVVEATDLYNELNKRIGHGHKPGKVSNVLTRLTFFGIMTGFAESLLQITQTPLLSYAELASRFGYVNAAKHFKTAYGDFIVGVANKDKGESEKHHYQIKTRTEDERRAMRDINKESVLIRGGFTKEVFDVDPTESSYISNKFGLTVRATENIAGAGFRFVEDLNRQVTFLATYRAAREKGFSHTAGLVAGKEVVAQTHFNYKWSNKPRFFKIPFLIPAAQFQMYALSHAFLIGRKIQQALTSDKSRAGREDKIAAGKMLLAYLSMNMLISGTAHSIVGKGAWFFSQILSALLHGLGLEDDEEAIDELFDSRLHIGQLRALFEPLPEPVRKALIYGAIPPLSKRASPAYVFDQYADKLEPNTSLLETLGSIIGGPAVSTAERLRRAVMDDIPDGDYWKAASGGAPKAFLIKDFIRALRLGMQGPTDSQGLPIKGVEVSDMDVAMSAMGLHPVELTNLRMFTYKANKARERINTKRRRVVLKVAKQMGIDPKNFDGNKLNYLQIRDILKDERIAEFNERYGWLSAINRSYIKSSLGRNIKRAGKPYELRTSGRFSDAMVTNDALWEYAQQVYTKDELLRLISKTGSDVRKSRSVSTERKREVIQSLIKRKRQLDALN